MIAAGKRSPNSNAEVMAQISWAPAASGDFGGRCPCINSAPGILRFLRDSFPEDLTPSYGGTQSSRITVDSGNKSSAQPNGAPMTLSYGIPITVAPTVEPVAKLSSCVRARLQSCRKRANRNSGFSRCGIANN